MGKAIGAIFGGKAPKTNKEPIAQTEEEKRKAKLARSALLETEGGILGQELADGGVSQRPTLLGN